jgi:signal transduction histidine kinase
VWNTSDDDLDVELGADLRRQVYLIFKESVNNISRHSRATEAVISLRTDGQDLVLAIRDNGRGFDLSHDGHGNGLKSIQARAAQLGANLNLYSVPGDGTSVSLRVSLPD